MLGPLPDERLIWMEGRGANRQVSYPHTDRRDSTIALSRAGQAVTTYAYDEYGQGRAQDGVTGYPFRYTGQRLDPYTQTYHYKAREYAPTLGRFLQPDPARFVDGPNVYAYVGNNPWNAVDPTGMHGKGSGWEGRDREWRQFNLAQQRVAGRMEGRVRQLNEAISSIENGGEASLSTISRFEREFGDGSATVENMRAVASALADAAASLRDDGSGGHFANAIPSGTWTGNPNVAARGEIGGNRMFVNVDHAIWSGSPWYVDGVEVDPEWPVGHESYHNGGLGHVNGPSGAVAYRYGDTPQQSAFAAVRGTPAAMRNPDNLMNYVY